MDQPTVLLIDDEIDILEEYSSLFDGRSLEILTSSSPIKALDLLSAQKIAVMVSDQQMPGMSGLELLQKAQSVSPDTIRVILTGFPEKEVILGAINDGRVFQFLEKPIDPEKLVGAVTEAAEYYAELEEARHFIAKRKHYVDASSDLEIVQTQLQEREAEIDMLLEESQKLASKQRDMFKLVLKNLVSMIQLKSQDLFQRARWVSAFSVKVAARLGLKEKEKNTIQIAGYLKNLGLILLPDTFTEKSFGMLDLKERKQYYRYPFLGEQVLKGLPGFESVSRAIADQLERFDGSGPRGKTGDVIPLASQIIGIAEDAHQILFTRSKDAARESIYGRTFMINHIRKNIKKLYAVLVAKATMEVLNQQE